MQLLRVQDIEASVPHKMTRCVTTASCVTYIAAPTQQVSITLPAPAALLSCSLMLPTALSTVPFSPLSPWRLATAQLLALVGARVCGH